MTEVLKAPASVTVATAISFARDVGDALARSDALALDLADLHEVDLSFLQIVHATRACAGRTKKVVRLVRAAPPAVKALLERAGFLDPPAREDLAFWFNEVVPQ